MTTSIKVRPVSAEEFAPFGELLAARDAPTRMINAGRCERHHALATVERGDGEAIISIFRSEPVSLPYDCALLERHPLGSQAFIPMSPSRFLVTVAEDAGGVPGTVIFWISVPGVPTTAPLRASCPSVS